ncbi:Uncharacterized protein SCG7086_CW_00020 [Chlamydiales bacterium SCGC AG-110-P3]|nr:Uncharacterized protein SCG7086_CW_00020 [Chlamydiales bacterium SCGC AG-110-P3]
MWQNKRSNEAELLDLGQDHYTQKEYHRCLQLICRINRVLGGFQGTYRAFKNLKEPPRSILEVGCGGGYLCHRLHRRCPEATILGIDICQDAIDHACTHLPVECEEKVSFAVQESKSLDYSDNSFEVITTMLVCHHMTDQELILFLQESFRVCSKAVIINDLHRHILAYLSFSLIVPFLFPNRLIWHDGRLSVRRSFRKQDWIRLLKKAGFKESQYDLKWNWAFRWTLTLKKQ